MIRLHAYRPLVHIQETNSNNPARVPHKNLHQPKKGFYCIIFPLLLLLLLLLLLIPINSRVSSFNVRAVCGVCGVCGVCDAGSGQVFPDYVSAPLDAIRAVFNIAPIPAPPLPTNNCSSAHWVHGVDFFNTDKQSSNGAKDVGDCCNQCGANPDCNAFTFVGGECWMKGDAKNPKANAAATSGFCAKGPPAPPPPPAADCNTQTGYCVHYSDGSDTSGAAAADAVLYFAGTTSSEGGDRGDLSLGDQDAEIASFAAVAGKKMAVVVVTPGAILTPWYVSHTYTHPCTNPLPHLPPHSTTFFARNDA